MATSWSPGIDVHRQDQTLPELQVLLLSDWLTWGKKCNEASWNIISPYCSLSDGTEEQPEQSDVICADCCNQLAVQGRHRICLISAAALIKETSATFIPLNAIWMFLSNQHDITAPNHASSVHSHFIQKRKNISSKTYDMSGLSDNTTDHMSVFSY